MNFPLLPITTATGNNACRVCVSFLYFPPSFRLRLLGLGTPSTTAWIVVFTVFITYLASAFPSTELPTVFISRVQVAANYPFVEFGSADVPQTRKGFGTRVELDKAESAWRPEGITLASSSMIGPNGNPLCIPIQTHNYTFYSSTLGGIRALVE